MKERTVGTLAGQNAQTRPQFLKGYAIKIAGRHDPSGFAASAADAERLTGELNRIHDDDYVAQREQLTFWGDDHDFLAIEVDVWDRIDDFRPTHPLAVPPAWCSVSPSPMYGEYQIEPLEWTSREAALEKAQLANQALLEDGAYLFKRVWWIVIERGECHLPSLVAVEINGDVGKLECLAPVPIRVVRVPAPEVAHEA